MDSQPQGSHPHITRTLLIASLAIVGVLIAWFVVAQQSPSMTKRTNTIANTNTPPTNTSTNHATNTAVNTTVPERHVYSGPGFTFEYPNDWAGHDLSSGVVGFGPADATYYSEGAIAYPVYLSLHTKSAAAYLVSTPASRVSATTIDNRSGFKVLDYGGADYFYMVDLTSGGSLSLGTAFAQLGMNNQSQEARELVAALNAIVNSLTIK